MTGVEHATPGMVVFLLITILAVLLLIRRARLGKAIYVRRIPGIDAIEEAVGRAAELGRPVSFTTGLTGVGPTLYACLGVLHYVARRAAIYGIRLVVPQSAPDAMAMTEDVVRDGYREEGRTSSFDPQSVLFLSEEQFAFASGYIGLIQREKVGAAFLMGSFAGESLILAEAGQQAGAMQVAASVSPEQVAFFVAACDYTLIGEELFAASSYLSKEPIQMGSILAQDFAKVITLCFIIFGVFVETLNHLGFIPFHFDPSAIISGGSDWIDALFNIIGFTQ